MRLPVPKIVKASTACDSEVRPDVARDRDGRPSRRWRCRAVVRIAKKARAHGRPTRAAAAKTHCTGTASMKLPAIAAATMPATEAPTRTFPSRTRARGRDRCLHQRRIGGDVRDGDDPEDRVVTASANGVAATTTLSRTPSAKASTRRDHTYDRQMREQIREDRRQKHPNERAGDDDRYVRRRAAHPPDDHRHEGDEHRYKSAGAERAEQVDPKVAADARRGPVQLCHGTEANGRYCALSPPREARGRVRDAVDIRRAAVRTRGGARSRRQRALRAAAGHHRVHRCRPRRRVRGRRAPSS